MRFLVDFIKRAEFDWADTMPNTERETERGEVACVWEKVDEWCHTMDANSRRDSGERLLSHSED